MRGLRHPYIINSESATKIEDFAFNLHNFTQSRSTTRSERTFIYFNDLKNTNSDITNIIRKKDIVRFVKARKTSRIGHVERMEDSRMPKRVMREKICTKTRKGRPKVRWLDDVQEDLREMGIEGWRRKAQDRDLWRRIAQEAKAHEGLYSQVEQPSSVSL
jgi:hypothetical protein